MNSESFFSGGKIRQQETGGSVTARPIFLPSPSAVNYGVSREHLAELQRVIYRRHRSRAIEQAIREECAVANAMIGPDEELSDEMRWQVAQRISQREISITYPEQQPLDLELAIEDEEQLKEICNALRRVGAQKKGPPASGDE